jgi:chromosome segregation ATPase
LSERDRRIAELQAEIEVLTTVLSAHEAERSEADQTEESAEALEPGLALEQVDRLDAALAELAGRTTDLERKLAEEQHAHGETREQRDAALDKANRDYDALEEACRALDTARSEANEARAESEAARREREEQISGLTAELEAARSALEHAREEPRLQPPIEQLRAEVDAARHREAEARLELADSVASTSRLESHLSAANARAAELSDEVAALQAALDEGRTAPADEPEPVTAAAEDHVCLIAGTEGYRLVDRPGPPPALGAAYDLDGALYVVTRVGGSPLPFDGRRCAYLLAG